MSNFHFIGNGFIQNRQGTYLFIDFQTSEVGGKPMVASCFHGNIFYIVCNEDFTTIQMENDFSLHLIQVYNRKLSPKKCDDGSSQIVLASNCNGDMILRPCLADAGFGLQIKDAFSKNRTIGGRICLSDICLNVGSKYDGRVKEDGQIRFEVTTNGKCVSFIAQALKLSNSMHNISDTDMWNVRGWARKDLLESGVNDYEGLIDIMGSDLPS